MKKIFKKKMHFFVKHFFANTSKMHLEYAINNKIIARKSHYKALFTVCVLILFYYYAYARKIFILRH